jgi:hypothetical protein
MAWEHMTEEEAHNEILRVLKGYVKMFENKLYLLESLSYEEEKSEIPLDGGLIDYKLTGKVWLRLEARRGK